jgi:uncharacterized protein
VIEIAERDGVTVFKVRVVPRARHNAVEGEYAQAIKVRLTSPAIENRANEALRRVLADCLSVPVSAVRILAGEKSRTKHVAIAGVSPAQVRALCAAPLNPVPISDDTAPKRKVNHG